ncbi:MAG: hypothetical protein OXI83_00955 [Gemmatimonadota bacterium]|nr:hypothetical protein [Gemmatimonadota bacterium]
MTSDHCREILRDELQPLVTRIVRMGTPGLLALTLTFGALPAVGQSNVGASLHVGTLGLGGRIVTALGDRVNIRGGVDIVPVGLQVEESEVEFDFHLPSPVLTAVLDLYPSASGFRMSAGGLLLGNEIRIEGTPAETVELGGNEYTPDELGVISGSLGTSRLAPYVGMGWGNALGAGLGFALDIGVAYHGPPDFTYEATGSAASDTQLIADLEEEAQVINDDLPGAASIYPVLNLGVSFGW